MKKKLIMVLLIGVMTLTSAMSTFAAPKQMTDGNVFDAEYYAANNPDVVAVYGTKAEDLYKHYLDCGKAEGRLPYEGAKVPVNPIAGAELVYSYVSDVMLKYRIEQYSNGIWVSKMLEGEGLCDEKYWILRTDFSDGLLDEDGNGIDDRDPYNDCGYTDLNYNAVADGAPNLKRYEWGYVTEEDFIRIGSCEHGVVNGTWICQNEDCEWDRARLRSYRIR